MSGVQDVIPAQETPRLPVVGGGTFPIHRIYCVGRNFADHAREMGAPIERGTPTIFHKPADAAWLHPVVPYPPGTNDLHHEVELVVALGQGATGLLAPGEGLACVYGYTVGLDLTRRDLQALAKEKRLPWDTSKGFDASAPMAALVPATRVGDLGSREIRLTVNGLLRQRSTLDDMLFSVDDIVRHLATLYTLQPGDLIFMGTPAGVAAFQRGDHFEASIDGIATLAGQIA